MQSLLLVGALVLVIAMLPLAIKWFQTRAGQGASVAGAGGRVLSAVAVGPQQRVITVEVGPVDAPVCLVLGVTQQSISCLHSFPAGGTAPGVLRVATASDTQTSDSHL